MASVEISGYHSGFSKVAHTKLLMELVGLGLADAKADTDALLDGRTIVVTVADVQAARILVERLSKLRAIARIVDDGG